MPIDSWALQNLKEVALEHINAENTVTYWDRGNTSDISGTKFEWLCFHPWTDNFQFFQFFCENIDQNLKPSQFI